MADDAHLWDLADDPSGPRVLHAGDSWEGQAYVYLAKDEIDIAAGSSDRPDQGVKVTSEFGTQITGPMSFADMPQNISVSGGYWCFNPLMLAAVGSSAALPIPTLVYSTPALLRSSKDMTSVASGLGL